MSGVFEKGDYREPLPEFKELGKKALKELSYFQDKFSSFDTDTTINSIRDTIVAEQLGFGLVNMNKHGFDAKRKESDEFLEVKQCGVSSKRWGGTWNDTNEEKARAFSSKRLFTAIAVWKGASDLQFIVYGQNSKLGAYLLKRIRERKKGSRSTQNIEITKLLEWGFVIVVPPEYSKQEITKQLLTYKKSLKKYIGPNTLKTLKEFFFR